MDKIKYVEDFIARWEASENDPNTTPEEQNKLIGEWFAWCEKNNEKCLSADELLAELKQFEADGDTYATGRA